MEVDKYVVFNYQEQAWYYGVMGRTAWLDAEVRAFPIAAGTDNFLYNHELGNDDGSTSPATPLAAYIESSPMSMGQGLVSLIYLILLLTDLRVLHLL